MAKKQKKSKTLGAELTYRGAKRLAITLGMSFPDATDADWTALSNYINNCNTKPDKSLIIKYDEWMDKQLEDLGYSENDPMRHYQLRLSYIGEDSKDKIPKRVKAASDKPPREPKPKKEVDKNGLWKGTKKSYTFELSRKGYSLDRVTGRVLKKFPDANVNSIKQWYKKAKKSDE